MINFFKSIYFWTIRKFAYLITKYIAPIHSPWSRKKLHFEDTITLEKNLQIGDILLTRTNGELSTILVPGYWKHAALYTGNRLIIDATSEGVKVRHIEDLVLRTDNIAVLRVKKLNSDDRKLVVKKAIQYIGCAYDEEFDTHDTHQLYCSELIFQAINQVNMGYLDLRNRLGLLTITPSDLYLAKDKFDVILEIKDR